LRVAGCGSRLGKGFAIRLCDEHETLLAFALLRLGTLSPITVHYTSTVGVGSSHIREYGRDKSWGSEIFIDNQQKSGFRKQSLKKKWHEFAARRGEPRSTRQGDRAEQSRAEEER
jgi:hypothetical protein